MRDIGIGLATVSALERYVQALSLTLIVEPALAGLKVSVVSSGFGTSLADRTGTTDSAGRVLIDGLRPGAYRVSLTPPPTHRFIGREVVLGDEGSVERLTLLAAPAKLSIPIQNARVTIGSAGSYSGPVRNLELPPGTYPVSVSKVGYLDYTASITVGPGEEKSLTPSLKREPMQYPVIHRHNWGRCWGTFLVSDDRLEYQQSGSSGKDSFEVPTTQISSVSQWSQNQL